MAVKSKYYDRNRFRKTYPRFRAEPKPGLITDGHVALEGLIVNFSDEDEKEIQLVGRYTRIPTVTITPLGDINNVNLFITQVTLGSVPSNGGRVVVVKMESSDKFTGQVHLQVMEA